VSPDLRRQRIGRWGEDFAARYLVERGDEILDRNYRTPYGEIDLITRRGSQTVFVEVKARTGTGFGLPEQAVTAVKQKHLLQAVQVYWLAHEPEGDWQVDVIAILIEPGTKEPQLAHFENALHG
jgi:putative endonuclease